MTRIARAYWGCEGFKHPTFDGSKKGVRVTWSSLTEAEQATALAQARKFAQEREALARATQADWDALHGLVTTLANRHIELEDSLTPAFEDILGRVQSLEADFNTQAQDGEEIYGPPRNLRERTAFFEQLCVRLLWEVKGLKDARERELEDTKEGIIEARPVREEAPARRALDMDSFERRLKALETGGPR